VKRNRVLARKDDSLNLIVEKRRTEKSHGRMAHDLLVRNDNHKSSEKKGEQKERKLWSCRFNGPHI
jgi:hypothetical protein